LRTGLFAFVLLAVGCGSSQDQDKVEERAAETPAPAKVAPVDPYAGTADQIKMIEGKLGEPFDLGDGLGVMLDDKHRAVVTRNGEQLAADRIRGDDRLDVYFAQGVCWRWDASRSAVGDDFMRLWYRRVDDEDADLELCKRALRYEIRIPPLGSEIDPKRLFECQLGRKSCPPSMPDEQSGCTGRGGCSIAIPDGRCCSFGKWVGYNRAFTRRLKSHREKHCEGVACMPSMDSPGLYRARCVDGRCVLDPDSRDDDLGPIDL